MYELDPTAILLAVLLGVGLPVCIIFMRQSVKVQRQQLIKDLEDVFHCPSLRAGHDQVIPSFEFVKFKYYLETPPGRRLNHTQDIPTSILLVASVPLIICLLIFGYIAISSMFSLVITPYAYFKFGPQLRPWNAALAIAYVGGYLFVIRDLLCSVENFDLGPARMLASALHILFGTATAVLISIAWRLLVPDLSQPEEAAANIAALPMFVTAFAVGYVPELGIRSLLRASKLRFFKREDTRIYKTLKSIPLEIIDGIDSVIRSRLWEFNVSTVQHLATANPVMLFVETPYGVYQIFDWVCQAQLCTAVGSKAFIGLSEIGIRTIFDLERAVFDPEISSSPIRHEIGKQIFQGWGANGQKPMGLIDNDSFAAEIDRIVVAFVGVAIDDLHVQRLRQIYNCIFERLGRENTRLDCASRRDPKRPRTASARVDATVSKVPENEIVVPISEAKMSGGPKSRLSPGPLEREG